MASSLEAVTVTLYGKSVNITLYGKKKNFKAKLRIVTAGIYPGLSGWAVSIIKCILIRERQGEF